MQARKSQETHSPASAEARESEHRGLLRWIGPLAALLVFAAVAYILHGEIARLHFDRVFAHLQAIPRRHVIAALGFTATSYWVLSGYDVLALHYLRRRLPYKRIVFTCFIASAFGHTLGFSAFTGGAIRFRLYASAGITAVEVATIAAFASLSIGIGLSTLAGISLFLSPAQAGAVLHLDHNLTFLVGALLLAAVTAYALWSTLSRGALEIRGWALRAPGPTIGLPQVALGVIDLSLAGSVLWWLLPSGSHVAFIPFIGAYAIAVIAGIVSHVPGGIGVFETVMLLILRGIPPEALLGSLLAYRAIYYLVPLLFGAVLFGHKELSASRSHLARARERAALYVAPVAPQIASALTFLAGTVLLVSGATPGINSRLALLHRFIPLAVLEVSNLVASVIGLGLLVLACALFRRVRAAYSISFYLLVCGVVASLLKGLRYEEAIVLALVLAVLALGRRAFYRPTAILDERFSPAWVASIAGVIILSVWIGFLVYRDVPYSDQLWWTFALHANAPRMLRASLAVVVLATAYLMLNLLRPARPAPAVASGRDLERARAIINRCDCSLANAALTGDKRLLFNESADTFLMYQVARNSWIALGDPVGPRAGAEELVWRFRELADRHGGQTVFYQTSAERLSLYVDLGLAPLKVGEEARVSLADFSLDRSSRSALRHSYRHAQRAGLTFEIVSAGGIDGLLPDLQRISDAWLGAKATGEKRFSMGCFSPQYLQNFPLAIVRAAGTPTAFANLWTTDTRAELAVDLMRFGPEAPPGAMDFLFLELMAWGRAQGYGWLNLGMAPLSGLDRHPLAPAWHRVGNFIFRHGEHFYNFEGLRHYKAKFDPRWEPRYLIARGGIALPRVLMDISTLIAGGVKELLV
ncbi:bifunctional lysylphosphatidylglycerol flippase/synthetase MprF [Gaiella sp.]|uniref:bifunctional lysylphosphatidylglycerol flippase/synthetase MprF n=1 Tax=Gaiella sp. TaxID=2663207 RepID=UPI002E3535AE|nr:bifunctional lysylphosphatidylglycerol flippase/synthetase MprF [Gaiella sp.]HEX5583246.1 bifunctional lysylphosphatidylglycerol flippase/synthetase MprF [Gaiella sp.]